MMCGIAGTIHTSNIHFHFLCCWCMAVSFVTWAPSFFKKPPFFVGATRSLPHRGSDIFYIFTFVYMFNEVYHG